MIFNINFLALASLTLATPSLIPKVVNSGANLVLARDLSEQLGIATPNFTDEASIWATTFHKHDANGDKYAVQLPRVYTAGHYDAASSEEHFLAYFTSDEWKVAAVPFSDLESRSAEFSASLTLKYCNKGHGSGTCTNFSLSYNSAGCQAAKGTNSIVITYSNNGAMVAWNKGGCTGSHTLFSNGCNGGNEDVNDETPGTNSFQYIVGCTF